MKERESFEKCHAVPLGLDIEFIEDESGGFYSDREVQFMYEGFKSGASYAAQGQYLRLEAKIKELESRQFPQDVEEFIQRQDAEPYGYLRENDGAIQISIGSERPADRSGGYATPWVAIYARPPKPAAHQADDRPVIACKHCGGFGEMTGEYPGVVCPVCNGTCVDAPAALPQVPEGYQVVPVSPNDAMQAAGATAIRIDTTVLNKMWTASAVFKAMLTAAKEEGR